MSGPKDACIAAEMLLKEFLAEAKEIISKEAEQFKEDPVGFVCEMDGVTPYSLEDCVRNGTELWQAVLFNEFLKKHTSAQWRNRWKSVVNSLLSVMIAAEYNVQTAYNVLDCGIDKESFSKMKRMLWMTHYIIVRTWS